ncbi:MAG: hypothetical protein K0A93_04270 [Desulfuromonadaceae bacterium]|nr:hypothetical protein [Desulfuromonadaceae bacterium]
MRQINRAAVLGSGVMGATIAAHLANAGLDVLLLAIVPRELTATEEGAGLTLESPQVRNRIGVYAIYNGMQHMVETGLSVEDVDMVAGPATARPQSAVFKTADLVGIDTLAHVGNNAYELLTDDEERDIFRVPEFVTAMIATGQDPVPDPLRCSGAEVHGQVG